MNSKILFFIINIITIKGSAEMTMIQLYIPTEISRESIYSLGSLGLVEFRDLNKNVNQFQRSFVNEIRKLDNVERQYRYLIKTMEEHEIFPPETLAIDYEESHKNTLSTSQLDEIYSNAQLLEDRVTQLSDASEELLKKQMDLKQYQQVLSATDKYFPGEVSRDLIDLNDEQGQALLEAGTERESNFITGVIPREKIPILEKILWRVLRGNLLFKTTEIEQKMYDQKAKEFVDKNSFVIFSHGEMIISRIRKICESLDANLYLVHADSKSRQSQQIQINEQLTDITNVLENTNLTLTTELRVISSEIDNWVKCVKLEKSVYEIMNRCHYDLGRKCLIGEGWVPTDDISIIQSTLEECSTKFSTDEDSTFPIIMNTVNTTRTPPTYHKVNKFTAAFQAMCDSYGIATYREVNAALPTAATFPFLFAIMFGDLGHGFIMFLAALTLVLNEVKIGRMKRDEIFDMAYSGRYILLFMGLFSMYTGFLYNDIFSISMTFFESGWKWPESWKEGDSIEAHQVGTYLIGLDPAWHGAENTLLFANSYKMKLSILMGFIHMSYSYVFSLVNAIHFNSMINIVGNFIPGFIFMHGIFGYLTICIIYKWCVDWVAIGKPAPSLLNMLINMFLSPGSIDEELYPGQATVQVFLLAAALICVPCLLLIKPLWFKHQESKKHIALTEDNEVGTDIDENNLLSNLDLGNDEEHEEETFGDVMIHQVIHTIEFCLNCVSHTASYLRLWALSLAHAQLSSVLWSMTLGSSFSFTGFGGSIFIFLMFGMWFVLTVCILVVMEGTSAMLHALRLHWVESMSKFFEGEGIPYTPYAFNAILETVAQ
ncbi:H(+)-transporting V0 sector ATPase subunit a [Pichia californica]|uniref:V-type proton ATPase subunit a n=1 Tax=Pichia californica TaxID=460514 RepID=A0A9P7BH37_9ASCO|nr:H(+)-transporting V0 sector ATPase subunit a [[Candida] californica]KAG0689524.1 H(+)-transporting V0 sector ATPase subunit a [[Candida] californica]